jgi:hypothetical protein
MPSDHMSQKGGRSALIFALENVPELRNVLEA